MRTAIACAIVMLLVQPAWAQDSVPEDTVGSGAITFEDLSEGLEVFATHREGIVVFFVLPVGWPVAEPGADRETGELSEELGRYTLLSRSLVADDDEAADLVFEMTVFSNALPEEWAEGTTEEEQAELEKSAFWDFLDVQMSQSLRAGLHCVTPAEEIKAKPYGTGTRPPTYFVPIFYEPQGGGARIYTFSSVYDGKVWMLKFLVKEDQIDNYGALIALITNNSFAMTEAEFEAGHYDIPPPQIENQ
jgi:hypothetical protein